MSLINQVLRDLDQRHAGPATIPSGVNAPSSPRGSLRRGRTLALSIGLALALAGGASAVAWNFGARSAHTAVALAPAAAAPTPVRQPTPVVIVTAPPSAPAAPASAAVESSAASSEDREPDAPSRPTPPANDAWPARLLASAPPARTVSALGAAPDAAPAAAAVQPPPTAVATAPASETRIEKRAPTRTARERAEADYQRGVAAHQQGQWADAEAAYAAALREEAGFARARQALAGVLIGQRRTDDALKLLSEGVAADPTHPALAMMLARLHAERGELQRAADILQAAAITSPGPEDNAFHAAILQRLNRHADAAALYAAALRVTPGNGVWWMGLGMSLAGDGRNDAAREAFNRARASGTLSPELGSYVEQRLRQLM
ncbi:tetratricopeptide repeat protein [Piscinibacter sp.]|uniref:tetratricopeptide repeat protein n=1 Tax=Piscinibacter sp. TaxID=1903157 RepID=UPI002BBA82C9|nr:tetratricopeptide repeat protein [Albitalea sp.]HUG21982.1 tetratricopeptide repeat protein [Albitalea sp.]